MRRTWLGFLCIAAVAVVSGCDDFDMGARVTEDFHYSYDMQPGGRLELENTNGSVEISGWDRNTIDVSGTKYASSDDLLRDIRIKVSVDGNTVTIHTETPGDFFHGNYGAKYIIRLPRRVTVDRAQTTNGSVSVEDIEGGGYVKSTNGHISMTRDDGNYEIDTTNGGIDLEDLNGNERAETTNGAIRGRIKAGALEATSTNGGIDVTIEKPQDGKTLRVHTTNGGITFALAEFHSNPITLETTHGGITLRIPADTNADLSAHTSFARITTDLNLSSSGDISKHEIDGRLGNGGPSISLHTTTGGIHVEKY